MAAEPRGAKRDLNRVPLPYSGVEGEGSGAQAPSAGGRARSVAPICARIARRFGSLANGVEPRSWLCDIPDGRTYPCDGRAHEFGNRAAAGAGRHRQWRNLCARRARHRSRLRCHSRHFRALRRYPRLCGADAWRLRAPSPSGNDLARAHPCRHRLGDGNPPGGARSQAQTDSSRPRALRLSAPPSRGARRLPGGQRALTTGRPLRSPSPWSCRSARSSIASPFGRLPTRPFSFSLWSPWRCISPSRASLSSTSGPKACARKP